MSLAEVRLQEGESLENALRRFKRKVQQEDIIKEVKRHSFVSVRQWPSGHRCKWKSCSRCGHKR